MTHKERLYNALKSECEAEINEALLTLDMCMNQPVAIGEHPTLLDDMEKLVHEIAENEHKLEALTKHCGE